MLVEQVDDVGPETLERCLGNLSDVLRPAIHAALGVQLEPELGGDHHLVTPGREGFTHELLVRKGTIDFRGIEERHAAFDGRAEQRDHLLLISRRTIGIAHAHTAEPDRRDFQVAISKFSLLHDLSFFANDTGSISNIERICACEPFPISPE